MKHNWVFVDRPDEKLVCALSCELNVPEVVARLLINRQVEDLESARRFLKPSLDDMYDPFLMADMDVAAERLHCAVRKGQGIVIHGDYDVDGVTGAATMIRALEKIGADVSFYVPDRFDEGYGISAKGIKEAKDSGAAVIVSVDCGITAIDEAALAKNLGIDLIITDHHEPSGVLPQALAVLDPKRADCSYPFEELSGAAVAFKLLQALFKEGNFDSDVLYENLDLVALGCAADIVPLIDENRILTKLGFEKINNTSNPGIRALIDTARLKGKTISTGQVVFGLAPRINAAGRIDNAMKAVEMLTTADEGLARYIADKLEVENRRRRELDEMTKDEALEMVQRTADTRNDPALVLASDNWHQGVIGIVASRVVEEYYLPTVLIALDGDIGKGSGRSIPNFNLFEALRECRDLLEAFGGHKAAAGLTVRRDKVDEFRERFKSVADERLRPEDKIPQLKIQDEIRLNEIDEKFLRLLKRFEPFGPENMKPRMVSRDLEVVGYPKIVGKDHLKFKVRQDQKVLDCIGFNMKDMLQTVKSSGGDLSLAYVIEENEWRGEKMIQLRLKDVRRKEDGFPRGG